MLIEVAAAQGDLILGAMAQVARPLSDSDRVTLEAAAHFMFGRTEPLDCAALAPVTPAQLASLRDTPDVAGEAVRCLAIMPFVDGKVDEAKIVRVREYADALGADGPYLEEITEAAKGHLRWAGMDMVRHNMLSLTGQPWASDDVMPWLLPYRGANEDQALARRFQDLQALPAGSLGYAFWDHYTRHHFAFPGAPDALNQAFAVPHDTTHLLSGYDTTYRGEILVSTFTAGMHPQEPMAGHILPVIFSWHLGIELIEHAGSHKGALDPAHFWEAWARGSETARDVFAPDWDFWASIERPLKDLRRQYGVPPKETV